MAPQFVKPYVKTNKNDAADAEAICEAVARPNMRFVPIKSIEQQAVLSLHRVRQGFVKARTAQGQPDSRTAGRIRADHSPGHRDIASGYRSCIEDAGNELPGSFRLLIHRLTEHLKELDRQVDEFEAQIKAWHRSNELEPQARRRSRASDPLRASALVASIGDANSFANGRQLAAWLGLVPRQHSSGGKTTLLGISKRGDVYLRTLLIHGARSAILAAQRKAVNSNVWLTGLLSARNPNVAAVALANKNARMVWALLAHGREFDPTTRPQPRPRNRSADRHTATSKQEIYTTDCSGDHAVMARQVRPWSAKPRLTAALRVRQSD